MKSPYRLFIKVIRHCLVNILLLPLSTPLFCHYAEGATGHVQFSHKKNNAENEKKQLRGTDQNIGISVKQSKDKKSRASGTGSMLSLSALPSQPLLKSEIVFRL